MPRSHHPEVAGTGGAAPLPPRRPSKTAVTAAVLALVTGAWLMHAGTRTSEPPAPGAADALARTGHHPGGAAGASGPRAGAPVAPLPYAVPQRIRIPSIKVDAPLMRLGVGKDNALQVPPADDLDLAGWYEGGAAPGSAGAAVIAGHVDTLKGAAVFYLLGSMHKGNTIQVTRADHRTAVFTVYGVEEYTKDKFPTDRVYDATPTPEIRVITCGGGFSSTTHHYLGNVVVYGRLTAVK